MRLEKEAKKFHVEMSAQLFHSMGSKVITITNRLECACSAQPSEAHRLS